MIKEGEYHYYYQAFYTPKNMNVEEVLEKLKSEQNEKLHLQIINPTFIVSERHISISVYHTLKAFTNKRNIARDPAAEFLLRVSGNRQIDNALKLFGIKKTCKIALIIAFGGGSEENKKAIQQFLEAVEISKSDQIQIHFPLLSLEELSKKYQCKNDIETIEKQVLEEIASLVVL